MEDTTFEGTPALWESYGGQEDDDGPELPGPDDEDGDDDEPGDEEPQD